MRRPQLFFSVVTVVIWILLLIVWEYRILWQNVKVWFENEFLVSRVFNCSSIIVGNILERTFIPSDVSLFNSSNFFYFSFPP